MKLYQKIFPWSKPSVDKFASVERYNAYLELMKCEECGQDLQNNDMITLVPHSTDKGERVVEARIVHEECL